MKRSVAADALDMSGAQAGTVAEAAYARLRKDIVWG